MLIIIHECLIQVTKQATRLDVLAFLLAPALHCLTAQDLRLIASSDNVPLLVAHIIEQTSDHVDVPQASPDQVRPRIVQERQLKQLVAANQIGKAVSKIESQVNRVRPLSTADPEVVTQLFELHPKANADDILHNQARARQIDEAGILSCSRNSSIHVSL